MGIIRVKDHIDTIMQQCFNDSIKNLLEFDVSSFQISLKDQFLHYYETAKFAGTLETLIRSIKYRIHKNEELLVRLKDLQTNLKKITDLGEYSKVKLRYLESLGTESSIGASISNSQTKNKQTDKYSGIEQNDNLNIIDDQTAESDTNETDNLQNYIPQPSIVDDNQSTNVNKYSIENNTINETPTGYVLKKLNKPEAKTEPSFQKITKDLSTNESNNTTITNTSRGGNYENKSDYKSTNTKIKGNKSDEDEKMVEFITNDARFRVWSKEIPKLKMKFWNSFFTLFCGFDYYER